MRFVRVVPRVYDTYVRHVTSTVVQSETLGEPMTLTGTPSMKPKLLGGSKVDGHRPFDGLGTLETFVCAGCGFVEWYCDDPQAIPIGHEFNSELVDYSSPTPYR